MVNPKLPDMEISNDEPCAEARQIKSKGIICLTNAQLVCHIQYYARNTTHRLQLMQALVCM
jgi:hypothetical protein